MLVALLIACLGVTFRRFSRLPPGELSAASPLVRHHNHCYLYSVACIC